MGLFGGIFKKRASADSIMAVHEELSDFLLDFVQIHANNGRESNTLKLQTTTSALFAAWYFVKNVGIENDMILNQKQLERANGIIDPLFAHTSSIILDHYKSVGQFPSNGNDEGFLSQVYDMQREKLGRYVESINGMIASGDRMRFGVDITKKVINDLFGAEFFDSTLKMAIIKTLATPCP